MDSVRAIVVPFNFHENYFSSTLWETANLLRNSSILPKFQLFRSFPKRPLSRKKSTNFAKFLQLSGVEWKFLSSVWYGGAGARRSSRTIHIRLTFPKKDAASSTRSNPCVAFHPGMPGSVPARHAALPAFLPCCPAAWCPWGWAICGGSGGFVPARAADGAVSLPECIWGLFV